MSQLKYHHFPHQGAVGTNITIDTLCGVMSNMKLGDPVSRYAAVNAMMLLIYGEKCLDFSYKKMIDDLKKEDWNSSAAEGGKLKGGYVKSGICHW